MRENLLTIYLNDHLAGSVVGVELAKRCLSNNEGTPLGRFLEKLLVEIQEDQDVLKDLIARLGARENPVKKAMGWIAEKVGRAKLNDELLHYSDLSRLDEIEGLTLGVRGKLALWDVLAEAHDLDARFSDIDFQEMKRRAKHQFDQLEQYRLEAARKAFFTSAEAAAP